MPLSAEELRRFAALERTVGKLAERVDALEKREVNLERLAAAAEDIANAQHGPWGGK
jgi:hypothetical protein